MTNISIHNNGVGLQTLNWPLQSSQTVTTHGKSAHIPVYSRLGAFRKVLSWGFPTFLKVSKAAGAALPWFLNTLQAAAAAAVRNGHSGGGGSTSGGAAAAAAPAAAQRRRQRRRRSRVRWWRCVRLGGDFPFSPVGTETHIPSAPQHRRHFLLFQAVLTSVWALANRK